MAGRVFLDIVDPWINWGWLSTHGPLFLAALEQHAWLTAIAVVIGTALSLPLGVAAHRWGLLRSPVLTVYGILYTTPSVARFSLLVPYTVLSRLPAEIVVVSYTA